MTERELVERLRDTIVSLSWPHERRGEIETLALEADNLLAGTAASAGSCACCGAATVWHKPGCSADPLIEARAERDRLAAQLREARAATRRECAEELEQELDDEAGDEAVAIWAARELVTEWRKSTPAAPAPDPAVQGKRCTCDYHVAPQRCRGAANLGPGWYCAEQHEGRPEPAPGGEEGERG